MIGDRRKLMIRLLRFYDLFEKIVTIVLTVFIIAIIIISLIRISQNFVDLFLSDFFDPEEITFNDYQEFFGKIMTLLISLEFLSSVLKVLKTHSVKRLVLDVILITALAIARKLIIYDYDHHDPSVTFSLSAVLVAIAIFYFLVKINLTRKWNKIGGYEK